MRQCVRMKLNSIRTRSLQILTGIALGAAASTPDVARAADQLAWDKTFPQSRRNSTLFPTLVTLTSTTG